MNGQITLWQWLKSLEHDDYTVKSLFSGAGGLDCGLEQAGLKGYSVGGAQVSTLHAGFIINTGNAMASDIYDLMKYVQDVVMKQSGVLLEPEVRLVGSFK